MKKISDFSRLMHYIVAIAFMAQTVGVAPVRADYPDEAPVDSSVYSPAAAQGESSLVAYGGNSCEALLNQGYKNISWSTNESDRHVAALHTFCSESYGTASSSTKAKLDGAFEVLKLGLGLEENNAQEAWTKYCELGVDIGIDRQFSSSYSETIYRGSLEAFNECVALTERGLHVTFDITNSDIAATIDLSYTGPVPINLVGIAQPDLGKAECFLPGRQLPLKPRFRIPLTPRKVTITCTRLFTKVGAILASDWTRVAFQTDDGTVNLDFAPLSLGRYSVAAIKRLNERVALLKDRVRVLGEENVQLEEELAAVKAAPAFAWVKTWNTPCESVCKAEGMTALTSGNHQNNPGAPYFVCSVNANGNGFRPGFNIQPNWANHCWVAWGTGVSALNDYQCLCERKR